jgi:hypothetical protein
LGRKRFIQLDQVDVLHCKAHRDLPIFFYPLRLGLAFRIGVEVTSGFNSLLPEFGLFCHFNKFGNRGGEALFSVTLDFLLA